MLLAAGAAVAPVPLRGRLTLARDQEPGAYTLLVSVEPAIAPGERRSRPATQWVDFEVQRQTLPAHVDMQSACAHAVHMSRMVQVRNVPDALHRKLKARAADAGQTLSDYLLAELERLAKRPTRDEMLAKLHSRRRVTLQTPAALVIRDERESA